MTRSILARTVTTCLLTPILMVAAFAAENPAPAAGGARPSTCCFEFFDYDCGYPDASATTGCAMDGAANGQGEWGLPPGYKIKSIIMFISGNGVNDSVQAKFTGKTSGTWNAKYGGLARGVYTVYAQLNFDDPCGNPLELSLPSVDIEVK